MKINHMSIKNNKSEISYFNIICFDKKKKDKYIEELKANLINFKYNENDFQYLFVFGGDNAFISSLKAFYNRNVLIILINDGRVGFISSFEKGRIIYDQIKNKKLYKEFNYLSVNKENIAINEIIIDSSKVVEAAFSINKTLFKKVLFSKVNVINNLGSTGLARSLRYPIILRDNEQYIIDFIGEPMYYYYKALNQAFVLNIKDEVVLNFNKKINIDLNIDNNKLKLKNIESINIKLNKSKAKVLNINDNKLLARKIDTLF